MVIYIYRVCDRVFMHRTLGDRQFISPYLSHAIKNELCAQLMRHLYRTNDAFVTLNSMHVVNSSATKQINDLFVVFFFGISRSKGIFLVNTNKEPPYAKGVLPEFTLSDNGTETTTVGVAES